MSLDRETLAAQCFVSQLNNLQFATEGIAQWAFDQADVFLAYAEKQRNQPEPPKCEHRWVTYHGPEKLISFCKICEVNKPEPVPKREAREVWVSFFSNGTPMHAFEKNHPSYECFLFREVLE